MSADYERRNRDERCPEEMSVETNLVLDATSHGVR